ncbi:hypothetical protein FLM55_07280 [Francisella sp. Scap27]|uniref:chalcone isomerase family protein n=1 Tax=Francisella sp. Scap27 TaxID=2589986 RepID=UPI0015BB7C32|nr:chalcone isomerase family protein [Francisella sp. Scap27]QLE79550.1 hypothetical protein FLM55_07280 [Francisella sp. Scap27]
MLRKLVVLFFITLPILSFSTEPKLNEILTTNNQQVGQVEFRKWFFHIYDAGLYTQNGKFDWNQPFTLKIHYLLSFKSRVITNRTISEIAKQHPEAVRQNRKKYKQIIAAVIPDIKKNSNLYGYMDKDGYGYIFTDQNLVGKINDKQLSKYFFEIWLSDNSANHQLSTKLRGLS